MEDPVQLRTRARKKRVDMNWSDEREQLGQLVRAVWIEWAKQQPAPKPSWLVPWDGLSEPDREVDRRIGEAIATRAVELAAARGTGKFIQCTRCHLIRDDDGENACECGNGGGRPVELPPSVGVRIVALEADKETLRAEIRQARLCIQELRGGTRETVHSLEQQRDTLHARVAALEAERDDLRLRLAALEVVGAKLSAHVDKTAGGNLTAVEATRNALGLPERYSCSPTCTHDDAVAPRYPERIRELSERMKQFPDVVDSKDERSPERVKERSEAFDAATQHAACPPSCLHYFSIEHIHDDAEAVGGGTFGGGFDAGFDKGAEAMRTACLASVREALANIGTWDRETERTVTAAIEGAVP